MAYSDKGLLPAIYHLRASWRVVVLSCAVAVTLTLAVSLLLTKQYTAVSRIVIEPPAGSDPRASTAVSPIYLESLRSYELFASSDDLFLQAVNRFGLRQGSEPIDKLKKSVLKAEMPRNTKILEIRATLPDPKMAHALALYIAEETVKLNQKLASAGDQELAGAAEEQASEARQRLQKAEEESARAETDEPADPLNAELDADQELRAQLQRELVESEVLSAEADPEGQSSRARAERYRQQLAALQRDMAVKQKLAGARSARMERLAAERAAAQAAAKAADARLQEARAQMGSRGERLRIIDPGITPERPSSPNIPLNIAIALFAAAVLSILYLVMQLSYAVEKTEFARRAMRVAGRHD